MVGVPYFQRNLGMLRRDGRLVSIAFLQGSKGEVDLLDFESKMVATVNKFIGTNDPVERKTLMKTYQKLYTENVYAVGLTQYSGALIINKRFANVSSGAPIFMYNWAEDNIIRERVYVPKDKQQNYELHPGTLPGAPGSAGAMK